MVTRRKQLAAKLYLAIEYIKDNGFSPKDTYRDDITETFSQMRSDFRGILTESKMKELKAAEDAYYELYDNFYANTDEQNEEILNKAWAHLDKVSPQMTEDVADQWL